MEKKFYEVSQTNSGGSFVTDEQVCHRLFIEADSSKEATIIAENLGCYWDGCEQGMDCPCCGDRWYPPSDYDYVDLEEINNKWGGYEVAVWIKEGKEKKDAVKKLKSKYPNSVWLVEPIIENKYGTDRVVGKIRMDNIVQYAQVMADLYGWTTPDCRIFYKDGTVKEVNSNKTL